MMRPPRPLSPAGWLIVLLAAAGCSTGPATSDVPVVPADLGADAGVDTRPGDDVPVDTTMADTTPEDLPEAGSGCTNDGDCHGDLANPVCDLTTGRCVQCRIDPDVCPPAMHCDEPSHRCVAGCRADEGCVPAGGTDAAVSARRCHTATHACVECVVDEHCAAGMLCVASSCVPGCNGAHGCATGQTCCASACVDTQANAAHCGHCDAPCTVPHAMPACTGGRCVIGACTAPWADCNHDASDGCETSTTTEAGHCGGCGMACTPPAHATAACTAGTCTPVCEADWGNCNGTLTDGCEADLRADPAHCGSCGGTCSVAHATAGCAMGRCTVATCASGWGDCDGMATNGCETELATTLAHCGSCGSACPTRAHSVPACMGAACTNACLADWLDCNAVATDGCEVDPRSDPAHCGACGRACAPAPNATPACPAGTCSLACSTGFEDCNGTYPDGCETDLRNTPAHCGACGNACPAVPHATPTCVSSSCGATCASGWGDCNGMPSDGCERALTTTSDCGACGRSCATGQACTGGTCIASCPPHSVCLQGTPNPATVLNTIDVTYYYSNNLVNGIWHRPTNRILAGHYSSSGYWSYPAGTGGYPAAPNNATGTPFARMVLIPGTSLVVHTDQAQYPSAASRLYVGSIDDATGALGTFATALFSDGFTGSCNLLSSSATEFLCFDGTAVRRYATTAGSRSMTLAGSVTLSPRPAGLCDTYCFGGTFAWDGMYYYFASSGNSSTNLSYQVYAASGALQGTYTATAPAAINGIYFDWSAGRYATHDGHGSRGGTVRYTWSGGTYTNDSQCYGPVSPYHSP